MSQSQASQPRPDSVIAGRYRLVRKLGGGAFGEVWLAEQRGDPQQLVVKFLHPQWARVPSVVERFRREALATTRVSHPNVCRVFEYATSEDDVPFITMEFLGGGTLGQELQRAGAMPVGRVAEWMAPVCEAVAAAHEVGIVHRDLKPDNIMLTERGGRWEPVVLDFGVAKLLDASEKLTLTGSMLGTPAYMSPEQCQGKTDIGPPADVYALAIISHELLVGRPPFASRHLAETAMKHVLEPPPRLADVPTALVDAVSRALAKNPEDRPPARLLADALREAAREAPEARASVIDIPAEQRFDADAPPAASTRGGGSPAARAPDRSDRPQAPPAAASPLPTPADSHDAPTVISMDGREIAARTAALLRRAGRPPESERSEVPVRLPPAALAFVVLALALIGALIGLLLKG